MKTAIFFYSKYHGNTRKLLNAIAAADPSVELIDVTTSGKTDLSDYDRIGIASGIYYSSSGMTEEITFLHCRAEQYEITDADSFFFFNPFSEQILRKVIDQILWSWYENPRKMRLFFYYPTDEDVALLMMTDELMFTDEIDCSDLFDENNKRERIMIFETE